MAKPSNELIVVEKIAAGEVFTSSDKVEALLKSVEEQALAIPADVTTEKGRAAIASLAHKVARSKTALEEMGKEFAGVVAESRRTIKDRLDALKVKVRQPLTDWEDADRKRREAHEAALAEITENGAVSMPAPSRVIQARLDWLEELPARDWEEFADRASAAIDGTRADLKAALAAAETREAEKAELERLRQEMADRVAKESEQQRREEDRQDRQERERVAEAYKATLDAEASAREAEQAAQREEEPIGGWKFPSPLVMQPVYPTEIKEEPAAADAEMVVRSSIVGSLVSLASIHPNDAEAIVDLIAAGKIPNVRIIY